MKYPEMWEKFKKRENRTNKYCRPKYCRTNTDYAVDTFDWQTYEEEEEKEEEEFRQRCMMRYGLPNYGPFSFHVWMNEDP